MRTVRHDWNAKKNYQAYLNANPSVTPVSQKRRVFFAEKSQVITQEVAGWLKARIVKPVRYPTWISNPMLVKKVDGSWRRCIDLKNINSACLKDYYPLPEIDRKIDLVTDFPFKCFFDAYKGYHQVQMAEAGEEKTTFYTDQGTFCYTKMPFGLKNTGETYQRLVDEAFKSQIGQNLKAYVDDMVAKYSVELGAYNITYEPHNAIKGQILADFINEVPARSEDMIPWTTPYTIDQKRDCKEEWVLYTDGASSVKGLASVAFNNLTKEILVEVLETPSTKMKEINAVVEEEGDNWMTPIIKCLNKGKWLEDTNEARSHTHENKPIRDGRWRPVQKVILNAPPPMCRSAASQLRNTRNTHGGMRHASKTSGGGSKSHPTRTITKSSRKGEAGDCSDRLLHQMDEAKPQAKTTGK
ncbi:reverse transcriptase domain-containing protein [Tanacetum coccineum]